MSEDALQRRRGPSAKSAVQRHRIVAVARDCFGTDGYRAAAMRDIVREVGLSQAGLLHRSPTKSGLVTAAHDQVHDVPTT
jgi:AcrR family transcriptional regulator